MAKMIRPFKVRRFEVETTFSGVEMSAVCRMVANTLTVTITKPFNGMVTQVHARYNVRIDKARDMAIDELELSYLDFIEVAKNFEAYRDAVLDENVKQNYELMKWKYKLSVGYDYAKQMVLWIIHNEEAAKKLIDAHNKEQTVLQAWLDGNSDMTWEEWLNRYNKK